MAGKVSLNVKVVAGSINLTAGGASYAVTSITSHPNYNAYTYLNDISVLKTSSSIAFSEQVRPLPISANFVEYNIHAVALGWGLTTVSDLRNKNQRILFEILLSFIVQLFPGGWLHL